MYALVEQVLEGLFSVPGSALIVCPRTEFGEYKPGKKVEVKFKVKTYPAKTISIGAIIDASIQDFKNSYLGQMREKLGTLEAANRKLMRINKDLESKCKFLGSGIAQNQSTSVVLDSPEQLKPGVVGDRRVAWEHNMIELVQGSHVFLYENQLKMATESSKSMTALARHLVDVFFSLDVQKVSNLTGSNGLNSLDKTVINAIVAYSVSCEQFKRQTPAEIRQSLRNKLGCLRAPSRMKD